LSSLIIGKILFVCNRRVNFLSEVIELPQVIFMALFARRHVKVAKWL